MPTHDIIDNRNAKLVDHLNGILGTAEAAKMAVGYFFLSGFGAVRERLSRLKSIRILIGNTSSRETVEQLSEACKRLELVQAAEEKERFQTKAIRRQRAAETCVTASVPPAPFSTTRPVTSSVRPAGFSN